MSLTLEKYLEMYAKDVPHAHEVKRLAGMIFDEVSHHIKEMPYSQKKLLETAALLHDIGYFVDSKGHNKHSQSLIIENGIQNFNSDETAMISCIARYHRGSLPDKTQHPIYMDFDKKERKIIKRLSGILRIADGLDGAHRALIKKVQIDFDHENSIAKFKLYPNIQEYRPDITYAARKRDLFETAFKCQSILVFNDK